MKKNYLLLLFLLCLSMLIKAQNVNISDANFKAYLVGNTQINTNGDAEIQVSEAEAFTDGIDVDNSNISDLTGIEAFTQITYLKCSDNNLTSLDVSKNTLLTTLWSDNNELTSLDVSQNTNLGFLTCKNNNLISLDLSKNIALTHLFCSDNNLTSIDVSQNVTLHSLYCSNNQLMSLDVSKNTALMYLSCKDNQLTSLDVSRNIALTYLWCSVNQLMSLDVSQNTILRGLSCRDNSLTNLDVSKNTVLEGLFCGNNQLTSLDVSKNAVLENLYCYNNNLTILHLDNRNNANMTSMLAYGNENLTCIQVDFEYATYPECDRVNYNGWCKDDTANYTEVCEVSEIVYIPDANFKSYLVANDLINTNGDLEIQVSEAETFTGEINVNDYNITNLKGIEAFFNLTKLSCYNNQLSSLDVSQNTALTELACYNNDLKSLNLKNGNNSNMQVMWSYGNEDLTCIQVDNENATYPSCDNNNYYGWCKDDTTSYSENCGASDEIVYIPDANFKSYLVNYDLINTNGDSEIQIREAEAFDRHISISTRDISDLTGIEAFINLKRLSIKNMNNLTSLDLSKNIKLTHLYCHDNNLTSLDLPKGNSLIRLICRHNQLMSLDVSKNTRLKFLSCSYNELSSLDVSQNSTLDFLVCSNNNLTSLNLKNGNNFNLWDMNALYNEDLTCIQVDDENAAYSSCDTSNIYNFKGWCKDDTASYGENCETASIDKVFNTNVSVAPNPVNNQLTISLPVLSEIKRVEVYFVLGNKILETKESTIDFSGFSKGVYLVKIESRDNKVALKKVIKN